MKIEYICHACLVIDTGDLRIATDPWLGGAAYCDQWYLFPKPVNKDALNDLDVILISHGHEDHLHEDTLKTLPRSARVFYPYSFFEGAKGYIESMGFPSVTEAVTFKKYKLSEKTSVTFIINSHDSLMVIESGGKVLINVNDALHSSPEKVIDFYLAAIRQKWKNIDVVFCGFGGASYFPNTMHLKGKDDLSTSIVREQLFAHNFCRIVAGLKPRVAVPFAADFALLDDKQRWINEARFPRDKIGDYYQKHFAQPGYETLIYDMYSGDVLDGTKLKPLSPYRPRMNEGSVNHLIDEQYAEEIVARRMIETTREEDANALLNDTRRNIEKRMKLFNPDKLKRLKFCLELSDVENENFFHIDFTGGELKTWRGGSADKDVLLTMKLSSKVLRYSIASDWGADVISIGYGAEIYISDEKTAQVDLESICMNLLACYPTTADLRRRPIRTLKFLLLGPPKFTTAIRKLRKFSHESENYDRKTWLLKDPAAIRDRYGLPELGEEFLPEGYTVTRL